VSGPPGAGRWTTLDWSYDLLAAHVSARLSPTIARRLLGTGWAGFAARGRGGLADRMMVGTADQMVVATRR